MLHVASESILLGVKATRLNANLNDASMFPEKKNLHQIWPEIS